MKAGVWDTHTIGTYYDTLRIPMQTREAQRSSLHEIMKFLGKEPEGTLFYRKKGSLGLLSKKNIAVRRCCGTTTVATQGGTYNGSRDQG